MKDHTYAVSRASADIVRRTSPEARITHEDGCNDVIRGDGARAADALVRIAAAAQGVVEDLASLESCSNQFPGHATLFVNISDESHTCEYPTTTNFVFGHLLAKLEIWLQTAFVPVATDCPYVGLLPEAG